MKVKEVSVTFGGKINLGDYNSAHVEITISAVLDDGDNYDEVIRGLRKDAQFEVREAAKELTRKRGARVSEVFAGLPVEVQQSMKE